MKISDYFIIQEFVPKPVFDRFADNSIWFIDTKLISIAEIIRSIFGKPVIINNWHTGGQYEESGLRSFNTLIGSTFSQHKYGRAIDCKIHGETDYEKVRNMIRSNWHLLKPAGLTTIEQGTGTWLHCDCRWTGLDKLFEVPFQ